MTNNPSAEWIAGDVIDAFPWDEAPRHLIRDRDGAFGPAFTRRIRAMGIQDHPLAARSPWQNGHVERLIGSIRRASLDHFVVYDEAHLRNLLKDYASYYNKVRPHLSVDKDAPVSRIEARDYILPSTVFMLLVRCSRSGSIHYVCNSWHPLFELLSVARETYSTL